MGLSTAHQPFLNLVQDGLIDGRFLSGAYTLIAAGPPRLANVGGSAVGLTFEEAGEVADQLFYPLGVIQNFNISQNRNFSRIFEIGSERSVWIPGRTMGQIGMGRVLYHGPSFLRVLYAYYQSLLPPTQFPPVFKNLAAQLVANQHNVIISPGFENLFINLASDLFHQPVGLLLYIKDSNEDTYGATYLESCVIPNHTLATDSNGVILQENVAMQYERMIPVAVKAIALISGGQVV
jgi:hypothetical protein